jgi:tetratricopeptide (TPR) repeat protein
MGRVAAGLVLLCTLCPGAAAAEPSVWDLARSPRTGEAEELLRTLGHWLDGAPQVDAESIRDFRLAPIAMLELKGARASDDPRVLLALGDALLRADVGREDEVRDLAERVLAGVGPGEEWLEADARLLYALASRGAPELAIRAATRALPLVWIPSARSTLLRERAEARLALGDARGSIRDLHAAIVAADLPVQKALARFLLGLALERLGDLPSGMAELRHAQAVAPRSGTSDLTVLDEPDVFLFRSQDVHYVSALAAMAAAATAVDVEAIRREYERAIRDWERFEIAAPPEDPWLGNARLHRRACERALSALAPAR